MRVRSFAYRLTLAILGAVMMSGVAEAQSLFQSLFGWGSSSSSHSSRSKAAPFSAVTRPVPSLKSFGRYSPYGSGQWGTSEEDGSFETEPADLGGYRTMCVRMCDGYYWPIRSSASESQFYKDAKLCETSCDCEAKLFYLPRSSDNVAHMTDLTGRSYGTLETAFKYRKRLSKTCTCKPVPWSQAEVSRHRVYAIMDIMKKQEQRLAEEQKAAEKAFAEAQEAAANAVKVAAAAIESPYQRDEPQTPVTSSEAATPSADSEGHPADAAASPAGAAEQSGTEPADALSTASVEPNHEDATSTSVIPMPGSSKAEAAARAPTLVKRTRNYRTSRRAAIATKTTLFSGFKSNFNW